MTNIKRKIFLNQLIMYADALVENNTTQYLLLGTESTIVDSNKVQGKLLICKKN